MKMNELDFDLDFNNVGSWATGYKVLFILLVVVMLTGFFYYAVINEQLKQLDQVTAKELALKNEFRAKAEMASHLAVYRGQIKEVNIILSSLVDKLPNKKELASLLDDISYIGSTNGLQFKSINWGVKKQAALYEEVPISIKVEGTYMQLGQFSASIAALSRMVSLDNIRITPLGKNHLLMLEVTAKTYRYQGQ
jgi:type IV pilus assembly protein PilO